MSTNPNPADQQPNGNPSGDAFVKESHEWWEDKLKSLPQEDRDAITSKIKGYDKGYRTLKDEHSQRMQALSEREQKIVEITEKLSKVQTTPPPTTKVGGEKLLDAWVEKAELEGDLQTAKTLRHMREMIHQETDLTELKKELQELKETNKFLKEAYLGDKTQSLTAQIKDLKGTYGDLVERYEGAIKDAVAKDPRLLSTGAERLLMYFAQPDEIRQALTVNARRTNREENPGRRSTPTGSEERPLHERFKGKNSGETALNYRKLVEEAVSKAREAKRAQLVS